MRDLQETLGEWAGMKLPLITTKGLLLKLKEEVDELLDPNTDFRDELADVVIICLVLADNLLIDLEDAILEKHARNQRRVFAYRGDGTYKHIGEGLKNEEL